LGRSSVKDGKLDAWGESVFVDMLASVIADVELD